MTSTADHTVTASRLRRGDRLPAYGVDASIAKNPVVSPDGSMVTALISTSEGSHLTLLRIPVDQPVQVVRDSGPERQFIKSTRTVRSSGARVAVLDLKHPDSEIEPTPEHSYATLCTTHHTVTLQTAITTAEAMASHPEGWCPPCATATRDRAHQRSQGPTVRTNRPAGSRRKPA